MTRLTHFLGNAYRNVSVTKVRYRLFTTQRTSQSRVTARYARTPCGSTRAYLTERTGQEKTRVEVADEEIH
jgi:hypothetical protein